MNTAKIAALYPYFLNALQQLHTGRSLEDLLSILMRAKLQQADATAPRLWVKLRDNENPTLRYTELGTTTDEELAELVPARVFEWVCRQMPAEPIYSSLAAEYEAHLASEKTGWKVTAHEILHEPTGSTGQPAPGRVPGGTGRYLRCTGSTPELAGLLRGLFALRTKRRKQLRRLVAQLRAYHAQQLAASAERAAALTLAEESTTAAALATLATGREVSCLHLTLDEHDRREELARQAEEQVQMQAGRPEGKYGREIMWHRLFAAEFVGIISEMRLPTITAYLGGSLAENMNQGNALDLADYCYLADCLREGLADNPTPLAALRLTRALTWVEQTGAALLATAHPYLTASQGDAAPALAA